LESRNDTLLRVSRCIVEQQQAFFEQGEEYMKPMVLADIAQAVAITGDVADTASADICMFRHLADISSVVPAARTLITLGTRYH
ncbi:hypothetical protein MJL79_32135, partial [Salmonella enterica subsp. enterica serovar Montevideo]|nr:hypothetical protein [Salmonella enterica subsp. enterica serovar Montevideo]